MPSTFKEEYLDKNRSLLSLQRKLTKEQTAKIEDQISSEKK